MEKIDFVITWVDGNDPKWQLEKNKYSPVREDVGSSENRFRDWNLLQYWFRGVEKYAPWVNKIYFVTWGHVPSWLNLNHPKLEIITHEQIIPKQYLPTFNSNVILLNIHRIPGLSEHFVVFNDDMYLTAPTSPDDFFIHNLPCESAVLDNLNSIMYEEVFPHMMINNISIINEHFKKKEVLRKYFHKFFSIRYRSGLVRAICCLPFKYFSNFKDPHVCSSYMKKSFVEVWEKEGRRLEEMMSNRFRTNQDFSEWLVKWWQFCKGEFEPRKTNWGCYVDFSNEIDYLKLMESKKYKVICFNDRGDLGSIDDIISDLQEAFNQYLPEKSEFEI